MTKQTYENLEKLFESYKANLNENINQDPNTTSFKIQRDDRSNYYETRGALLYLLRITKEIELAEFLDYCEKLRDIDRWYMDEIWKKWRQ